MRKIYSTTVLAQAEILRVVLRRHGIESVLENENAAMAVAAVPIPAVPFVISVDDQDAEEATRIVLAELKGEHAPIGSAIHVRTPCACGKMIDVLQGEDPPEECPWCGRRFGSTEAPVAPSRTSRPVVALIVLAVIFILGLLFWGGFPAIRKPQEGTRNLTRQADARGESTIPQLMENLLARMDSVPVPRIVPVDPEPILAALTAELPEERTRFAATLAEAKTPSAIAEAWLRGLIDRCPDWALEAGLAESPRLERYSERAAKTGVLFEALALRRLRELVPRPASIEDRMFERHLERNLLAHEIFGARITDPRTGILGVQASYQVKDNPALLAQRLEDVPGMLDALQAELKSPPQLWIDLALRDLNDAMHLLREFELSGGGGRVHAAVTTARNALSGYGTRLRTLRAENHPLPPRNPRWITFLLRDAEFSDRSPREVVRVLLEEASRSHARWSAGLDKPPPSVAPFTTDEWFREVQSMVDRARQLTLERGVAEVPSDEPPRVTRSWLLVSGAHDWPYYGCQPLAPAMNARVWVRLWDSREAPTSACSKTIAQVNVLAEIFPGRHLHDLLSRRAPLVRKTCGTLSLGEGWRERCVQWALEVLPGTASESTLLEGHRFTRCWTAAVETCFLSGALTEFQAVEMLMAGLAGSEDEARERLAWAMLNPAYWASGILGERDIAVVLAEQQTRLGAAFDLKRFHTRLLGYGQTPIALIREDLRRDAK
jgi:hypothetical protein